jgi:Asp-tRNA(Asn)/Glu-tRNA(Gln) amidotransferase A subunit family amidase
MKVMISQPMKGKTEEQIRNERAAAVARIEAAGDIVVDTIFPDFKNEGNVPLKYLAKSLDAMADVDAVLFLDGWESARGCIIEHSAAEAYGIRVMEAGRTTERD